jgi:hypothetical protein
MVAVSSLASPLPTLGIRSSALVSPSADLAGEYAAYGSLEPVAQIGMGRDARAAG